MANSLTHALPYPIRNARFALQVAFRVAAGTPTDPTTPDTEKSTDGGATFSDTAEEITTGGTNGAGYLTLTGAETDNPELWIAAKSANCLTSLISLHPRNLAIVGSGTLSAGSAGGGTLGTLLAYDVTGCFIRTTGGTGGGGTGGANNQARRIITYNTSTGAFTVSPNWETTPDNTTTYDVLLPEGVTLGMLKALNPATAGRTLVVDSAGLADANTVKVGPSGSGTVQTAGDLAALITTVDDLLDTEIAAIASAVAALNDPSAAEIADAVWDEATVGHTTSGTFGEQVKTDIDAVLADTNELQTDWANAGRLDTILDTAATEATNAAAYGATLTATLTPVGSTVADAAASTTSFKTALTQVNDFWNDAIITFTSGALLGQSRTILDFANTNGVITLDEALTSAPANGVTFTIQATHVHPVSQIQSGLATQASVDTIDDLLDTEIAALTAAVAAIGTDVDAVLLDTGTDGVLLTAAAIDSIHDEPITEPSGRPAWASMTHRKIQQTLGVMMLNEINSDSDSVDVRNDADTATLWSYPSSDDGSTYTSGKAA